MNAATSNKRDAPRSPAITSRGSNLQAPELITRRVIISIFEHLKMDRSQINDWLALIANLAVVGGIVFLAIEIRQNNELLRSESRQTLVSNDVTSLSANIGNADVFAKMASGQDLSAEEQLRLSFMFMLDLRNREFEYFQYINGLLDEETWLAYRYVIVVNHSTKLGRAWWDQVGRGIVDPGFARMVDELLAGAPADDVYKRMATWADD